MSDLQNPLFDDEREFLERQKLEYERALLGDVEEIKGQTVRIGKYVAIGAAILGGFWLVSKALGSGDDDDDEKEFKKARRKLKKGKGRKHQPPHLVAQSDDFGFGGGEPYPAAQLAPPVYHASAPADSDPFPAFDTPTPTSSVVHASAYRAGNTGGYSSPEPQSSFLFETVRAFAASDTGKMLIGQLSGVLIAMATRKMNEWMEMNKNSDLAASATEPETKDIDFVIHHDDAHAPDATAR